MSAVESDDTPASNVASSIFESVLFSGNIVKSIHTGEEEESAAAPSEATAVPNHTSAHGEVMLLCQSFIFAAKVTHMHATHARAEEAGSK
jgi:hypothetical protein